jgi:hypothetical protein
MGQRVPPGRQPEAALTVNTTDDRLLAGGAGVSDRLVSAAETAREMGYGEPRLPGPRPPVTDDRLLAGVRDGNWLSAQDFSGRIEAAELLDEGRCSPQCLLARESGECACRCAGKFHGVLATALVHPDRGSLSRPWYARYCGYHQSLLDALCPVIPAGRRAFSARYRAARRAREPLAIARRLGSAWEAYFDAETEDCDSRLSDEASQVWTDLIQALMWARRVRTGSGGGSLLVAGGIKKQAEAQVLGTLAIEFLTGNLDGGRSCLRALAEDGFSRWA